ncbi:glycosyltransferase family 4 protein [Campylobacter sp. faydin G-140]|uniref:glycosyltransferase family 4 protein n=1 Tax=Campylobacter anatolicus TaxID=2829105 RepID=UPI001B9C8F5C|nr:glycosyltransferase family 1 protein [Campylobacter anatolicus]MBR8466375.1 glycosyltransferase family 4 protein [Campylobacter anatolicus]
MKKTKLTIDFRMHNSSGIGTYIKSIIPFLVDKFNIILLGSANDIQKYDWSDKVKIIECNCKIYSIKEQFELALKIPKCDIFWSPHYNIPIFHIRANKRVVTIHDVFHLAFYDKLTLAQRIYAKLIINQATNISDQILTVSNFSVNEIRKYTKISKNIDIVYNAVDFNKFNNSYNTLKLQNIKNRYNLPDKFLLFVGNVKPHKNLKSLLLAIINLNINLVIVGKKDNFITSEYSILDTINNAGLKDRVFFTGYINDDDVPCIYNLATLFVFPSIYEGFGIPPLEAQACGCPVVCSNAASLLEVCGDSVVYFDPYNVDDMRDKIGIVLNDKKLQLKLKQKGFENVKRFSWERSANQIIKIFKNLETK